jgi:hypothetical protein
MIVVGCARIGGHGKSEKISASGLSRRLIIEWTALLPHTRREAVTR